MSLLVVHQIDFLEEFLLADLTAKLRLLQVHLSVGEKSSRGLQHLSAVGTLLLSGLCSFWFLRRRCRVTGLMFDEALQTVEFQVALAADLVTMNCRLVIVQVALLRVCAGAVTALITADEMTLEVISKQSKLLGIVVTHDACKNNRLLLMRLFVVELKGRAVIEDVGGRTVGA